MLFTVNNSSKIDAIWSFVESRSQESEIYMYRPRISPGHVAWVVEILEPIVITRFLLEFSQSVTHINSLR